MQIYFWTKTAHVVFVIAWMATVFYLPRILVNLAEAGDEPSVRARLLLMGRRLYRFGHNMFGMAFLFGLALWRGWRVWPHALPMMFAAEGWLHAKLALVALLLAYFIIAGRWLRGAGKAVRCRRRRRCAGSTNCRCCCWSAWSTWCWRRSRILARAELARL